MDKESPAVITTSAMIITSPCMLGGRKVLFLFCASMHAVLHRALFWLCYGLMCVGVTASRLCCRDKWLTLSLSAYISPTVATCVGAGGTEVRLR